MKLRSRTKGLAPRLAETSCSLAVLAGMGVLMTMPPLARAAGPLPVGTLPVPRVVSADPSRGNVVSGVATVTSSGSTMTVNQSSARAIFDWKSFDIANGSEVRFNQATGPTASALNRIYGLNPTVIQGKLTANGQVLLINQNGILFDRGTQINVQSLVASTLNLSNSAFISGALTTGGLSTPAFVGGYDPSDAGNGTTTSVRIGGAGAIAVGSVVPGGMGTAPNLAANAGGSIVLVAPRIDNASGIITAPDGQVILAAGGKVYLALADGSDPTLRGFQVEVEAAPDSALNVSNLIRNAGAISADRGNVTLAALAVNQEGRISATTAVQANGSIFLQARTLGGAQSGSVNIASGSVAEVRPDLQDKSTIPESQRFDNPLDDRRGEIRVTGRTITSQGALRAPGGKITITASDVNDPSGARVYFDAGSETNVAGNWTDIPFENNLLTFKVTSNELKDSPDQKNGFLRGSTVTVDLRKGSPLLDLSGYQAAQDRTVAEKTAVGGALTVSSSGSLIERPGAILDASGGGYRYGAGMSSTSQLLGADGRIYDISNAPEQRTYASLLDTFTRSFNRWGQTQTYTGLTFGVGQSEAAYVEGKAGGTIALQSSAGLVLDGGLLGGVTVGPRQLTAAPRGALLTIGTFDGVANDFVPAQRIGDVTFAQKSRDTLGANFNAVSALGTARTDVVVLAAEQLFGASSLIDRNTLRQAAFDSVEINSNGRIVVPDGVDIQGAPGSSLLLRAPRIDVAGKVTMPAGAITMQPVSTGAPLNGDMSLASTAVTVHGGAALSTAGVWLNNSSSDGSFVGDALPAGRQNIAQDGSVGTTTTSMLSGGRIAITGNASNTSSTVLERGAVLDVGGGAALSGKNQVTAGDGGTISIVNGLSTALSSDWLQADLWAFAAGNGGRLSITSPRFLISPTAANGTVPSNTTRLAPGLFSEHGFSNVSLVANQGILVESDTTLTPRQANRVIDPLLAAALPTGGDVRAVSTVQVLPDDQRRPTSVSLAAPPGGAVPGGATLVVANGASIVADPRATITLSASDGLQMNGRLVAPGGTVSLALNAPLDLGTPDLLVGPLASISTASTFVRKPSNDGLVQGTMIDAGAITITASNAGVDLAAGSRLDLHGSTQLVESLAPTDGRTVVQQKVDGNAGSLTVRSQGRTLLQSTLQASGGSSSGAGGAFGLELNARDSEPTVPAERRIVVTQGSAPLVTDQARVDAAVSIDALEAAGFDKLRLQSENRIELRGDIDASFARGIRLDAPLLDVTGDGKVSLNAASVALGQSRDPRVLSGAAPFVLAPQGASPTLVSRAGSAVLSVSADTIDLFGSLQLNGTREARLFADGDIRMTGRNVIGAPDAAGDKVFGSQTGSLTTSGNLLLDAAQIYPSTRTDFTVATADAPAGPARPGSFIAVSSNGHVAGDIYSADGRLALRADAVTQGGVVKAPLGQIDLQGTSRVELSAGSVTSVSADGLTIPYGTTLAGLSWRYQDNLAAGNPNALTTASADAKRVTLSGANIDIRAGASVDLQGGGDVQAVEFVPGSGGSKDTLAQPNTYAIIPKSQLTSMPVDTDIAQTRDVGFGLQTGSYDKSVYDRLVIGGGAAVPAGEYVLLPGRYALLPGAFLVQLQTGAAYANLQPNQTLALANGQLVASGQRTVGGTDVRESRTVGVIVRPGSAAALESDYTVTTASYFTDLAAQARTASPRVPLDAGRLAISDATALNLSGTVRSAPGSVTILGATQTGRSAEVDISASRIAVVDHLGSGAFDASYLELESGALSALGGDLLLGGLRSTQGDSLRITTGASSIVVANSSAAPLTAPELLLVASDIIDVRANAVLSGTGVANSKSVASLKTDAGGALLRASSGSAVVIDRGTSTDATRGTLRVDASATLSADKSLQLDATRTTQSQGRLAVAAGGEVSLASSKVSLGDVAGIAGLADGLVLSNADLAGLAGLDALTLKGYQGLDLYGNAVLGAATLGQLTLDANAIRGHAVGGAAAAQIRGDQVRFVNTGSGIATGAGAPVGSLAIDAARIVMDSGDKRIAGYGSVTMTATSEVVAQGAGSLDVAADWTLRTPKIAAAAGSQQALRAADESGVVPVWSALTIGNSSGTAGTTADDAAGGRLRLEGRTVSIGTRVQARSGSIAVLANGSDSRDDVSLVDGAVLDASAAAKSFNGRIVTADAGSVSLHSQAGAAMVGTGARITLGSSTNGGDAGTLVVAANRLELSGTIDATAKAGALGGSARLDIGTAVDVSNLAGALGRGGFDESIDLRVRTGDIRVGTGDVLKARAIQLASDKGRIDIDGTLDARNARGGATVDVAAANGLALGAGSRVLAGATSVATGADAPGANGGTVRLATATGRMDFDAAASIDVSPGAKGDTGAVTFVVSRDASNTVAPTQLAGTVTGRNGSSGTDASVALEAQRTYTSSGTILAADVARYAADHAAFVASVTPTALLGSVRGDGDARPSTSVRGAVEVRSAGDLSLAQVWDLTNPSWLTGGLPGTLTLRAGGDLRIASALGMANDNLISGKTWNLRLVGGADLAAADAMATLSPASADGHGSVILSSNASKVRTGTGSIDIAAALDFRMDTPQSLVYTAGRIGAADTAVNGNNRWAVDGGDVRIRAGRDAVGNSDEWITEWLRRPRSASSTTAAEWWAYRPNFQQGLGTLGGGDISIDAGHDIRNLSAMLPTTGRSVTLANGSRTLDVQGGGDLSISAGHDLIGGSYLIGRGAGDVHTGGSFGATTPSQVFLMGVSSGGAPAQASFSVQSGDGVAVQSVNNPTVLAQVLSAGTGPSFGGGPTQVVTYFTYAPDSSVALLSASGSVSVGSQLAPGRGLGATRTISDTTNNGAFPASLEATALAGDVLLGATRSITTFPSPTAQVALLAQGSVVDANLTVSDRTPSTLPNPSSAILGNVSLDGAVLQAVGTDRIVNRTSSAAYPFDIQALDGDLRGSTGNGVQLYLPAVSRLRAGRDISNLALTLQNLSPDDVTELRADGDVRPNGVEIRGPGTLLVQAGRNVDLGQSRVSAAQSGADLGGLIATGSNANAALPSSDAARISVLAGVKGSIDLAAFKTAYGDLIGLGGTSDTILAFYRALNADPNRDAVLAAGGVGELIARDVAYAPFRDVATRFPRVLSLYQDVAKAGTLPLGTSSDAAQATALYALLNKESDVSRIIAAKSVADLAAGTSGGAAYLDYAALDAKYPLIFSDYRTRRSHGASPEGLTPVLLSSLLGEVTAKVVPADQVSPGSIFTYRSSIQTYGNGSTPPAGCAGACSGQGDIDLWAPGGTIIAGLTTPTPGSTIGVVTNGGGAIRSVAGDNFEINQGKVLTAQGGDILLYSSGGSIDAGRGAKTSISTPPPTRTPITVEGVIVGFLYTIPASASGSGIQTLSSDPDGNGPRTAAAPGNVYLFAPAGTIDAGEAGIRSGGNIIISAPTVLNSSNIAFGGSSSGVPIAPTGSLASAVATSGATTTASASAADDAAKAAAAATRAATAAAAARPNILSVEVLGFGEKNCKEQDKDCFAK